jgi:hypothetical protein
LGPETRGLETQGSRTPVSGAAESARGEAGTLEQRRSSSLDSGSLKGKVPRCWLVKFLRGGGGWDPELLGTACWGPCKARVCLRLSVRSEESKPVWGTMRNKDRTFWGSCEG